METSVFEILGKIAGLAGLSLGIFLLLFREFIKKNIFRNLNQHQTFSLMRLFLILTFLLAMIGIIAWIFPSIFNHEKDPSSYFPPKENFKRIYYESFEVADLSKEQKRFEGIWQIGEKGDWIGTIDSGFYRLINFENISTASFTNTLRYFDKDDNIIDLGESKVAVKIRLSPPFSSYSSAGIKYRSSSDLNSYYAFALNAGGSVSLMYKNEKSMKILWSDEIDKKNKEFISLKVIGKGKELELFVEDKLIHIEKTDSIISGNPGIFAYSTGTFDFDDFNVFIKTGK